ncbi:MAG: redoxin family protein [Candidatus Nitrosocaldaceae archaeon]
MIGSKAPEISNFEWLNTDKSLTLKELNGYIIVLDFWTYCCINCMHMINTLQNIEEIYSNKPVVVIGIHSAKFYNEQIKENVKQAIERYEIKHPVVLDKDMKIWRAYGVNAWPTIVIIDPKGYIIYKQAGEGQDEYIKDTIDTLLARHRIVKEPFKLKNNIKNKRILSFPAKISFNNEMLAIADSNNNRVLIASVDGKIEEIVGGEKGFMDGELENARFHKPQSVLWLDNKIYVADTWNHALREIDLKKKIVKTLAGNGQEGFYLTSNDAHYALLNSPWDLAFKDSYLYIAMAGLHQIWRYDIERERIEVFAGNGYEGLMDGSIEEAEFAQPSGLSISDDKLYVADSETSSIRAIDLKDEIVKTIVGKDLFIFGYKDGRLSDALLQHPMGLDINDERIYVADTYNHAIRVIYNNSIYTLISSNIKCTPEECNTLMLYEPTGIKYYKRRLYISDTNNHLIRVYNLDTNILDTLKIRE